MPKIIFAREKVLFQDSLKGTLALFLPSSLLRKVSPLSDLAISKGRCKCAPHSVLPTITGEREENFRTFEILSYE